MKRNGFSAMQRGAALIMALLVVALATVIASSMIERQNLWLRQLETRRDLAQARLLAIAGVDWARAILAEDVRTTAYDHLGEPWATKVPPMPAEGGEVGGGLTDEQGKWNLNNLVRNGQRSQDDLTMFRHLLGLLQLPPDLAATLADWLDADSDVSPGGAEDAYYLALNPPYRAANRELGDVDGLLHVRGFDANIVERLRPYVSALPGYNPVNINTADAIVLSAVLYDYPASEIQQIVAERKRIPYIDIGDFRKRVSIPDLASSPNTERLDTRSRYFSATIHARFGVAETALTALLDRQTGWPTIVWQKFE
jgi:general secretion pathway protein K